MNEILQSYIEDLKDNLICFNKALIELQNGARDSEVINTIFRAAHTIKGNSAAMEFTNIGKIMHSMEDILQDVRTGARTVTEAILNSLYTCHDFLEDCIEIVEKHGADNEVDITRMENVLHSIAEGNAKSEEKQNKLEEIVSDDIHLDNVNIDIEDFKIEPELWMVALENCKRGLNVYKIEVILNDTTVMKSVRAWLIYEKVDSFATLIGSKPQRPEEEAFRKGEFVFEESSMELIVLTDKYINELINEIENCVGVESVKAYVVQTKNIDKEEEKTNGQLIQEDKEHQVIKEAIKPAIKEQFIEQKKETSGLKTEGGFVKVPVGKVDGLMDMLGELLILNSQLEQNVKESYSENVRMMNTLSRSAKLIKGIQSLSMALRMIEIKPTLYRLHRIARDTAVELDKKLSIVIEGEDTEIDRSVAEKLFDPLMHLVRNAVSHGIEEEEERVRQGKSPEGTVTVRAYNKRGNAYIEVCDDGKGINTEVILQKAISLKIAEETREYSEEEIIKFIFKPGFSTQEQINSISGRGVGMNVVEEEITKMGGKIEIENAIGHGCKFILKIPTNLVVVNGTIVEVANGRYIIPTLFIKEFYIAKEEDWVSMQGHKQAVRIRDKVIPIINASKIFAFDDDQSKEKRELVIFELEQKLLAFPVDRILSRQELVTKPLGSEFSGIGYALGASILGDGMVSLILDVEAIFKMAEI